MKKIILFLLTGLSVGISFSQEKYAPFIMEMQKVFERQKRNYEKITNKALRKHFGKDGVPCYEYVFIPELLLKKSRKLYQKVDTTNMVQYFDPKSMYYSLTIVHDCISYIGEVSESGNRNYIYSPNPKCPDFLYEELFLSIKEIQPDIVFEIQNVGRFFYIKSNKLYALYHLGRGTPLIICTIDEYTKQFNHDIFDPLVFKYTPKLRDIICK